MGGHDGLGLPLPMIESDVVKNITKLYMGGARRIGNAQRMGQAHKRKLQSSISKAES